MKTTLWIGMLVAAFCLAGCNTLASLNERSSDDVSSDTTSTADGVDVVDEDTSDEPVCGGADLQSDPLNCGGCGEDCGAAGSCIEGSCDTVVAIDTDGPFTCALRTGGKVACWGVDLFPDEMSVPTQIVGVVGATDIAVGATHACACNAQGEVWCWGNSSAGQLGSLVQSQSAKKVLLAEPLFELDAGGKFTCGLTSAGKVICWGGNKGYEIGLNTLTDHEAPSNNGLTGMEVLSAGGRQACAADGSVVKCWGTNEFSVNGDPTTEVATTPLSGDPEIKGPFDLSVALTHTCVLNDNPISGGLSGLFCWGENGDSELGVPASPGEGTTFLAFDPIPERVFVGPARTCVVTNGNVSCWGNNEYGQLGPDVTTSPQMEPATIPNINSAVELAVGDTYTCALSSDGRVSCWGDGNGGRLGNGLDSSSPTPVPVVF